MKYLATKLAEGRATVAPMTSWWLRHSEGLNCYLLSKRVENFHAAASARLIMADIAKEWECTARHGKASQGLMIDHTFLEEAMVDAALDSDTVLVGKIGKLLAENAYSQTISYGNSIKDFPARVYSNLLKKHISLFIEGLGKHMDGNFVGFKNCEKRRRKNAAFLAAMTAEWF